MHITRTWPIGNNRTPTPRQYMDGLVGLGIGFQYDETNDYYIWKPTENPSAPFYIDIASHTKVNWTGGTLNSSNTYKLYVFNKNTDSQISQFGASAVNASYNSCFDYIKFGETLLYYTTNAQVMPYTIAEVFIAPKSEDDTWYFQNDSNNLYSFRASSGTLRPFYEGNNDGAGTNIPSAVRLGKYYDGYEGRFADNLYIATIRPLMWQKGFVEAVVNDRHFILCTFTSNAANALALDITDYEEE